MKIRNGFVSNSSSSSFVLIVEKQDAINCLDFLEKNNSGIKEKIIGVSTSFKNIFIFSGMSCDSYSWLENLDLTYEEWYKFTTQIFKLNKEEYFYETMEM